MMKTLCIALAVLAAAGAAQADPLPQVLQETISGDLSEIMLGQLAGRRSGSAEVRAFGRALAEDHTGIELKAVALAKSAGITPPTRPTDAGRLAYDRLQALAGPAFDQAFLSHAIGALQREIAALKSLTDPRTSDFAQDAVSVLQTRLKAAQALQGLAGGGDDHGAGPQ